MAATHASWLAIVLVLVSALHAVLGCSDAPQALALHNQFRAQHGAPPLRWDARAAARAKVWSQRLANAGCRLQHSPWGFRSPCGENLYALFGLADTGLCSAATKMWYDEKKLFKWSTKPWSANSGQFGQIGHFSQVVWRSTIAVGCAAATGKRCTAVTCHYVTSGNMVTDQAFADNVRKAIGEA